MTRVYSTSSSITVQTETGETPGLGETDLSRIYRSWDFSDYDDDTEISGINGLWTGSHNYSDKQHVVSDILNNGNKTLINTIPEGAPHSGNDQYGYWGFGHDIASGNRPEAGDEMWVRFFEKYSDNWDWMHSAGNTIYKWIRSHPISHVGYIDFYFGFDEPTNWTNGYPWFINEGAVIGNKDPSTPNYEGGGWNRLESVNTPRPIAAGFNCYEAYFYYRGDFINDGKVLAKFWKDGYWLGDLIATVDVPVRTMQKTTDVIDKTLIHTVWQSWAPVPATQQSWISDPAIAIRRVNGRDDTPYMARDENGFPYIGLKQ